MPPLPDLNSMLLDELLAHLVSPDDLRALWAMAKTEDLGTVGDVTTILMIDENQRAGAKVVAREAGRLAGLRTLPALLHAYESSCTFTWDLVDGDAVAPGTAVGTISGKLADVLVIERPLLNLLGHLSGIASLTAQFVEAVKGTDANICDTRKTMPGWRGLEKYAVRCGGGHLHRAGLHDAVLVKDNHLAGVSTGELTIHLSAKLQAARERYELRFIEIEVDSLDQLDAVLACEPGLLDLILLDNFTNDDLREAVARRNTKNRKIGLEASGRVTLETVRAIAETGVDRISIGALTHSAPALDLGLDIT